MKYLKTKHAKIIIDLLLIAGLILSLIPSGLQSTTSQFWHSTHCINGIIWYFLTIIHLYQHWKFIKALTKKKVLLKNKFTVLSIIGFIFITAGILLITISPNPPFTKFHHISGHIYIIIILIHTIQKFKRLISLFNNK